VTSVLTQFTPATDPRVVISEVLKDPHGLESTCPGGACLEFIELTNLGPEPFSLQSLLLTDGQVIDSIVSWTGSPGLHPRCTTGIDSLAPGWIAVILDPHYGSAGPGSRLAIAEQTVLLTVDHSSLLGGLSTNRGFLLYRGTRAAVERELALFADSAATGAGERIVQVSPSGIREGISIVPAHLLFDAPRYRPNPDSLDPGRVACLQGQWLLEYRLVSVPAVSAAACSVAVLPPPAGAGEFLSCEWSIRAGKDGAAVDAGRYGSDTLPWRFVAKIPFSDRAPVLTIVPEDGMQISRQIDLSSVWLPPGAVRIGEISPRATDRSPEWVELTNASSVPVNLRGWRFGTPEDYESAGEQGYTIAPGSRCVLTRDRDKFCRAWPVCSSVREPAHWVALDNHRDTVYLWSPLQKDPVDTAIYDYTWFDDWENGSLERLQVDSAARSSADWAVAAFPSPGRPNGSVRWRSATRPILEIGPVPFTPDSDRRDDLLCIRLMLPPSHHADVSIIGFDGRLVKKIRGAFPGEYFWDGLTDHGSPAPVGPFLVVAELEDPRGSVSSIRKRGILWR
jgi:hypothetical protein